MSFLLCVPLMIGIKISTVGLLFFKIHQTPHRDEVHFLRFFRLYTLVSPIIPDQSQKNVGEKSVDNSGETWLRLGLLFVAQAQDPEVEARRIMSAALTFHRGTKATYLLCALVRTACDIIPTRPSGKGLCYACVNINRVDFEVAQFI